MPRTHRLRVGSGEIFVRVGTNFMTKFLGFIRVYQYQGSKTLNRGFALLGLRI